MSEKLYQAILTKGKTSKNRFSDEVGEVLTNNLEGVKMEFGNYMLTRLLGVVISYTQPGFL